MVKFLFAACVVASTILTTSVALQVTPNSDCASLCIDEATQDKSDPNVSNTEGSDIVCRDENYFNTVGQKFKNCVTCLQNSTASTPTESDLAWFLYNIRYAINSCVFGLHNATDPLSSPCSIKQSCGPLIGALQDGMDKPTSSNRYSYCTAFGGSFLGSRLGPCERCLALTSEQRYTANFMVALKAGCSQQPEIGSLIGVDGDLFSKTIVNVTSPIVSPVAESDNHGGLNLGAYIGIGVGAFVIFLVIVAIIFVFLARRKNRRRKLMIPSKLDGRFGNGRVTVPVPGAYNDPYPPKPLPYESVNSVLLPPRTRTSPSPSRSYTPEDYAYAHSEGHSRHGSTASRPIEMTQGLSTLNPYRPRQPVQAEQVSHPLPRYSPPAWSPPENTPPINTPSPTSTANTAHSRTQLTRAPSSAAASTHTITPPAINQSNAGTILPKPVLPTRSNSNATVGSSYQIRPGRHTRDLSVGRGALEEHASSQISGPIITVTTRFDEEEEARKRKERERLYREGFSIKPKKKDDEDDKEETPIKGSPESEEMWPGNY